MKTLLTIFLSLLTLTTAIHHPHPNPDQTQDQNQDKKNPLISPSTASKLNQTNTLTHQIGALIAHDAAESMNPNTCPLTHKSKQCCTSINGVADGITDEVGKIVPLFSGVEVSSILGLQCKGMEDEEPNSNCLDSVMCCDGEKKPGAMSIFKTQCEPYEDAMANKQKAIEKSLVRQSQFMAEAASSSAASPSASQSSFSGSLRVEASPTSV